jgi:hypothetical protein
MFGSDKINRMTARVIKLGTGFFTELLYRNDWQGSTLQTSGSSPLSSRPSQLWVIGPIYEVSTGANITMDHLLHEQKTKLGPLGKAMDRASMER